MKLRSLRQATTLTLTLLTFAVAPVLASPKNLPGVHSYYPSGAVARAEYRESQNLVFPGHDGHIMPPMPEDWVRYHKAEAALPPFPCAPPRNGRGRRKH